MSSTKSASGQSGFSLMELMVAMVVTLIVTGAVYGLLAGGNNAFRREPELMDRQQNIRIAMDLIMRDLQTAGAGMPAFVQSFARGLNDCTPGTNPCAAVIPNTQPSAVPGLGSGRPDEIMALGNPGNFDGESTCHYGGGSASQVSMNAGQTGIAPGSVIIVFMSDGTWTIVNANDTDNSSKTGANNCDSKQSHAMISFNSGRADPTGLNQPGGLCTASGVGTATTSANCVPVMIGRGEMISYMVRFDTSNVPNLYRRSTGGLTTDFFGGGGWQLVAKGIEDMQIQYRHLDLATMLPGAWEDEPRLVQGCNPADPNADCCDPNCYSASEWEAVTGGAVTAVPLGCQQPSGCSQPSNDGYSRLVTEVRVTLSSRAEETRLQGVTANTVAGTRVRGSLTQTISPRSTLFAMSRRPTANGGPVWR